MSGIISGTRNKTRFAVYIPLGVTMSLLLSQYDVTAFDWVEILTTGIIPVGGLSLFITAILYELKLDTEIDHIFTNLSVYGSFRKPKEGTNESKPVDENSAIQRISKQMASVNVLISPWALLTWTSIQDDLVRAAEAVVEEKYVQNILWEIKGGFTLGIFAFFAFLTGPASNWIFTIAGVSAAIAIMAVPALRSDSRSLPEKIRKVALVRHMVEGLEGSELFHSVVMGKMEESGDAPSDTAYAQDTLSEWRRQICEGCKKLELTITGGKWGQFDVQYQWTLRKLGAVVDSPIGIDHARAVMANTWTRVFVERFIGRDPDFITISDEFVRNVSYAYESAYSDDLTPLEDVLYMPLDFYDPETFLKKIPLELIWSGTFWEIVYLQQKVSRDRKADLTNWLANWWEPSLVPIDFLKDIYKEINTGTHQLGMEKETPMPVEDFAFSQAVYAVFVMRWDELSPNMREIRASIVRPLVKLIYYQPPATPGEKPLEFSKDQLEQVLLQILNECPYYHPREVILNEYFAICDAGMKRIVEYIFTTMVPQHDSRYFSLIDRTKSNIIGHPDYGSVEEVMKKFGFELPPLD